MGERSVAILGVARRRLAALAATLSSLASGLLLPAGGLALDPGLSPASRRGFHQAYVFPDRPGQNRPRYYDFAWRRYDFLQKEDGTGGVRLYFYDSEYEVARLAAAVVRKEWERLIQAFHYTPSERVPYILYSTHREFEATNVFPVNEFILGVTSPVDLKMSLPYWGEHRRFAEVSSHEMTHQFTIQKLNDRARAHGTGLSAIPLPLWFIEGLAEYYAHRGMDPEADMFARDLLLNPVWERGYVVPAFPEDRPGDFIYTYKMGQARVTFLAETYGEAKVQEILDEAPRFAGTPGQDGFMRLVSHVTGSEAAVVESRWQRWMKKRYYPTYLESRHDRADSVEPGQALPGEVEAYTTGMGGRLIFYRSVDRETGRAKLYLADVEDPLGAVEVAADGEPGVESLHPVERRVMAVGQNAIAYIARDGPGDVLYVQDLSVAPRESARRTAAGAGSDNPPLDLTLGTLRRYPLGEADLLEAGDPAFSPDGREVAFVGLSKKGYEDIYVVPLSEGMKGLVRLTNDWYSEKDVAWDEKGIVYSGDETEHGFFNLFRIDPRTKKKERLTFETADHLDPAPSGEEVFFWSDRGGKRDVHVLRLPDLQPASDAPPGLQGSHGELVRLTDFATGLTSPRPAPGSGLYALGFYGGRFRLLKFARASLLELDRRPVGAANGPPHTFDQEDIPRDSIAYDPFAPKNWRVEGGGAVIGSSAIGQGAIYLADVLRDRSLYLNFAIYGDLDLTDALLLYIDRANRPVWAVGLFHTFELMRSDPRFRSILRDQAGVTAFDSTYLQRKFGVTGVLSYPLDTFARVETELTLQGVQRELLPVLELGTVGPDGSVQPRTEAEWNEAYGGLDGEAVAAVRLGYDTVRYHWASGPISGGSALLEFGAGYLPWQGHHLHYYAQTDLQRFLHVAGRAAVMFRLAAGSSFGGRFKRQFFVSSVDNLRGFQWGDRRLLGGHYYVGNVELRVPLDAIIRFALFQGIEGIAGMDFGGVSEDVADLWNKRTLAAVLGVNFGLGPFALRLHFGRPIGVGGLSPMNDGWVTNLSLRYLYE